MLEQHYSSINVVNIIPVIVKYAEDDNLAVITVT